MLITLFYTTVFAIVLVTLLIGALVKGGKNLTQKVVGVVGYIGKGIMNLLLTNIVRTMAFFAIGGMAAITMTIVAIVIVII